MKKIVLVILSFALLSIPLLSACSTTTNVLVPPDSTTQGVPQWSVQPAQAKTLDKGKQYTATISTNAGDIVVDLLAQEAPLAVANFVFLARQGFYTTMPFFQVVPGYFISSGDPWKNGTGGPTQTGCGYKFSDDLPITRDYVAGSLVMWNNGPNTNGSMFSITVSNLSDTSSPYYDDFVNKTHVIFGIVTNGLNVAANLSNVSASPNTGIPWDPTTAYIAKVTITEK